MSAETQVSFPEDATHTDEVFFFRTRGVGLSKLHVRFQVQSELAHWHEVLAKLNLEVLDDGQRCRAAFFSLPERLEQFRPFMTTLVAWDKDMPGTATWDFRWSRSPDDSPPEVMVESSRTVGSFPSVLDRLGALWPVTRPVDAEIRANYLILGEDLRFTLAPARAQHVVAGEQILNVNPSVWTINPPSGCVREISQQSKAPSGKSFVLQGRGNYTLQWTPRFLNEVDGAIWDGLRIFLKPRRSKPKR
ncbi:hypothetical protein POL68_15610 [Stigmatella sp. ncwal1]|uniref:Uncharacterized protein n=1 Tax=Stigmatella ashevillensis TaxID=2995309 RepID=A0ABT5D8A5_9BACT|nr:hypothetical protein [Stigmatella ashevillena]MDC0709900.1 hypothetical protein [Stigmatella ashevillena]